MGAVLLTDLPDDETWAGIPARPLHRAADGHRPGERRARDDGTAVRA
jgi:serine acetyltransferase